MAEAEFRTEGGTIFIPGHGRIGDLADLAYYRDMVTIIRDRVQWMMKKDMSLAQIKAAKPTEDWNGRFGKNPNWTPDMFVEAIYKGLSGGEEMNSQTLRAALLDRQFPRYSHMPNRVDAAPLVRLPHGKSQAPLDISGYWVSEIVDEWRFRVSPIKGDILYMPLNPEARRIANAWDPAKDEAEGNQCKAYGAVGVMQRPGRLHITWVDDNTLKIETDAGTQTRLLHFVPTGSRSRRSTQWDCRRNPR